jgi:hypothetical protein
VPWKISENKPYLTVKLIRLFKTSPMKSGKIMKHMGSFVLLVILASGCLEYTMTTRVLPDGSIERTIVVKGDSAEIFKGSLPVPVDSTWKISGGYEEKSAGDSTDKKQYVYKASKVFRNSAELNKELNPVSEEAGRIIREVKVEKKFRWFNTFYKYAETYKQTFPFHRKPVDEFLNDRELEFAWADDKDLYYSRESDALMILKDTLVRPALSVKDSARMKELKEAIEKKFYQWARTNVYEEYFNVLKDALHKSGIMKPEETDKTRDSLFARFDTCYTDIDSFFKMMDDQYGNNLLELASKYYHADTARLHQANRTGFDAFDKKLENIEPIFGDSYVNLTIMPGIIISSNSTEINGNTASWDVESDHFYAKDFTLLVESKKINKGLSIVSGALVVFLLIGLVAGIMKRK